MIVTCAQTYPQPQGSNDKTPPQSVTVLPRKPERYPSFSFALTTAKGVTVNLDDFGDAVSRTLKVSVPLEAARVSRSTSEADAGNHRSTSAESNSSSSTLARPNDWLMTTIDTRFEYSAKYDDDSDIVERSDTCSDSGTQYESCALDELEDGRSGCAGSYASRGLRETGWSRVVRACRSLFQALKRLGSPALWGRM
ncbi:hypothetical protein D9611_007563 [Ephemerocybe angulata]|uniref:Uncharacterized protein n=1 Tax=Ephemerocybe angulata TaxID=980116 RepID=A0A8H5FC31_9AGAR|nr:hypothetical protein D9611_007563 [Tulosesus angulatus]